MGLLTALVEASRSAMDVFTAILKSKGKRAGERFEKQRKEAHEKQVDRVRRAVERRRLHNAAKNAKPKRDPEEPLPQNVRGFRKRSS